MNIAFNELQYYYMDVVINIYYKKVLLNLFLKIMLILINKNQYFFLSKKCRGVSNFTLLAITSSIFT